MTKPYKCRVEYLESTGTQYIDTGFTPTSDNFKFEIKMLSQDTSAYLGYRSVNSGTATGDMRWFFNYSDGRVAIRYGNTTENSTLSFNTQTTHRFYFNGSSLYVDDVHYLTTTKKYATPAYKSFYLFSVNASGYYSADIASFVGRIYYTKIWDNDVLVRDFIPVLDNSGKPAMYDRVSGQLFYNQGSGDDFSYGRQIIPVEYLESTGEQYIDTGVGGDLTTELTCEAAIVQAGNASVTNIMGNNVTSSRAITINMSANIANPSPSRIRFGNTDNTTDAGAINLNTFYKYNTNKNELTVKDSSGTVLNTYPLNATTAFTTNGNILIYKLGDTSTQYIGKIKVKGATIKNNGVLVRDFIPCIDENLTPFMFDKVNCTVYLNAGTGQFKVGSNVEKVWGGKKLRRKLALALANLKKKRKYYCEVEYLESTGTQWIDTGIAPSNITPIAKMKFVPTQQYSSGSYGIFGCFGANNTRFQVFYNSIGIGTYVSKSWQVNTTYELELNGKVPSATINGSVETSGYSNVNGFSSDNMYLFTRNNGNVADSGVPLKLYYCKIWDDGVLVRDMIPVLDWNYVPCMFDRVSERLFYNAGSGNFIAGREIHPVDYLESTGVEYIDTGIKFDGANTKIELKTYEDSLTRRHSICGDDGNFFYYFRGTGNWAVGYNGTAANIDLYMSVGDNVFVMDKNNVYINGVLAKTYTLSSNVSAYNALLFNRKTSLVDNGAVTMYYCKIWNNSALVRDYIPAIDENGVGFMFDRVSHTIYDNVGTGAFKYSAREVEYLQSDGARAILAGLTVDDTCGYDVKWMALNADDRIIMGTKGSGDSRWVLSGSNNPNVNLSWNTSSGGVGLGLNKIQTAQMNYFNDRKRILNDTPLADITTTLSANASTYNVGIFAGYWGATTISLYSTCRIYYVKITKGAELVRDFIPMVKDGSPCLYDKVGGEYYFGIGTGTFTRGKIVEPEYE